MSDFIGVFFDPEYGHDWFPGLMVLILSAYVAAPALGSIGLVEAQRRWPLFQRSLIAAGISGAVLSFAAGVLWMSAVNGFADNYQQHKAVYRALPYLPLAAVAIAVWFQYFNRQSFTRARGVGIACAVLVPVVFFIGGAIDAMN
jgi:hypothetical protein